MKQKEKSLENIKDEKLDELKNKLSKIKIKIDKFKENVLKKFDKYVIGIALLPPRNDEKNKILHCMRIIKI